jgi:hypothetical protein
MARLSQIPGERELQQYVLLAIGWLIVGVLVVFAARLPELLDDPSGSESDQQFGLVPLRAGLGAVMSLISLRLLQLARRHDAAIRRVLGLRRQYVTAAVVTMVLGVAAIFFWWAALPATFVGLITLVLVGRIRTVPAEQMTEKIDHRDAEAWRGGRLGDRPLLAFGLAVVAGVVLVAVILGALFLAYG